MMRRSLALAALASLAAAPAAAQATLTANAGPASAYLWRGITFTSRPVVQADLSLALPLAGGTLSGGAWANAEPAAYAGAGELTMNAGDGAAVTEVDLWAEYGAAAGPVGVAAGVISYRFPNRSGFTEVYNTSEVYVRATLASAFSPTLAVYRDVGKVNGTYAEASVTQPLAVAPGVTLTLGALAGASRGMTAGDQGDNSIFTRNGLTHADLWVSAPIAAGGVTVTPTAHLVLGSDPAARLAAPERERGAKAWIGARVSWGRTLGRAAGN